jgi:hypothetical protein
MAERMSTIMMSPSTAGLPPGASSSPFSSYYPSVSRSDELLSCAKTAVKMAQRQYANRASTADESAGWWSHYNPSDMTLYQVELSTASSTTLVLEDGLTLLRTMEGELKQLESLVRRRGHTNDPTEEITLTVKRLEADTKELSTLIQTMIPPKARGQWRKHWETLQQWFQSVAQKQGERLKEILKVRGKVLEEQQHRRKRFQASSAPMQTSKTAYHDNPLFQIQKVKTTAASNAIKASMNGSSSSSSVTAQATEPQSAPSTLMNGQSKYGNHLPPAMKVNHRPPLTAGGYYASSSSSNGTSSTTSHLYNSSSAGYGGTAAATSSSYYGSNHQTSGMRQRRVGQQQMHQSQNNNNNNNQQDSHTQFLIQQQQVERATQQRVQEAQQAERSLTELSSLFGKMSSLISQQSEVVDKIEDDVEAACLDVTAGHAEITTLYSIKKGNRALILKVFGLLIFFIIFMRLYAKK